MENLGNIVYYIDLLNSVTKKVLLRWILIDDEIEVYSVVNGGYVREKMMGRDGQLLQFSDGLDYLKNIGFEYANSSRTEVTKIYIKTKQDLGKLTEKLFRVSYSTLGE